MSGPSRSLLLFMGAALLSGALYAQLLPDIGEVQVEGVNLVLLDDKGGRRGTLKGKRAVRSRDQRVEITSAVLELIHGDSLLKLEFAKATYKPGSREIDLPEGLTGVLPGGGSLIFTKGLMVIDDERPLAVTASTQGRTGLRLGPEDSPEFDCALQSAAITLDFDRSRRLERAVVTGPRGADFSLRMAAVPAWSAAVDAPGHLSAGCTGPVRLELSQTVGTCTLKLESRCRVRLKAQTDSDLSSDHLEARGLLAGSGATIHYLRARGNVDVRDVRLVAVADEAEFTEGDSRKLNLLRDPRVTLMRDDGSVECRAHERMTLETSTGTGTQIIELDGDARASGMQTVSVGGETIRGEWTVEGQSCVLIQSVDASGAMRHEYRCSRQGFAPLLTLVLDDGRRVILRGESAAGVMQGDKIGADIAGPDIHVAMDGVPTLVSTLRTALGMKDVIAGPQIVARLTLRASREMRVEIGLAASATMRMHARGDVLIDQAPADLGQRMSASSEECVIAARAGGLEELRLVPGNSARSLLSLGADLVECRQLSLAALGQDYSADLLGPGRIVFRDGATLRYIRQALAELPSSQTQLVPDAGWLVFDREANLRTRQDDRVIVARNAEFKLLRGDFVPPRTGLEAFKDLHELFAEDVRAVYEARGTALFATLRAERSRDSGESIVRLDGPAEVKSLADGLWARAADAISIRRTHHEDRLGDYFDISLIRDAVVELAEAGIFLGQDNRGNFPFTGAWRTRASNLVRLRLRPPPGSMDRVGRAVAAAARGGLDESALRLTACSLRLELAAAFGRLDPARQAAYAAQLIRARQALIRTATLAQAAMLMRSRKDLKGATYARALALTELRFAQGALGPQVDLEAEGQVLARFEQPRRDNTKPPALEMTLQRVEMSLDGLGTVRALEAQGPVTMTGDSYRLEGDRFERNPNGALTLVNARLILSPKAGVNVEGLTRLEIEAESRPRVRAMGKKLKLVVGLSATENPGDGK